MLPIILKHLKKDAYCLDLTKCNNDNSTSTITVKHSIALTGKLCLIDILTSIKEYFSANNMYYLHSMHSPIILNIENNCENKEENIKIIKMISDVFGDK